MLNPGANALALMRVGFGRGGGFFELIILLAVVGIVAWALTRPSANGAAKTVSAGPIQPGTNSDAAKN
jgi:uncharacterized membrane protein